MFFQARKARVPSTETKNKRRRKSGESSSSRIQNKVNSSSEKDSHTVKTSPLPPVSSTANSIPCSSKGIVSRVQEFTNNSLHQNFSENKRESVVNKHELPRNLGLVDSHPSEAKARSIAEERNTVTKVPEMALPLVREESPKKMTPRESTGDIIKEVPPRGVTSWGSETTANDEPSFSANITESFDVSNGEIQECTNKASVTKDVAEEVPKTTVSRGLLEKPSLTASKKQGTVGSEIVSGKGVVTENLKTSELRSLLEKASSGKPVNEEKHSSKLTSFEKESEWLASAASEGLKKPSVKVAEQEVSESPSSSSRNSFSDKCKLSTNISEENQIGKSQDVASNFMEAESSIVSTKPSLGPGTKRSTTNCFSVFSSNSAEQSGELFANKELRTYSKKVTPVKRKSSFKESNVQDNSVVSKVFRIDNSKSPEVDIKMLVQENRKVELSNVLLNSQPEQTLFNKQHENMVPSEERGKMSRKKSSSDIKLPAKKAKCEENRSSRVSADSALDTSVGHEDVKDKDSNVVNSVSFVADQAVKDIAINHSPTMKDAPATQFEVVKQNSERLSRSKERIREMTSKRKRLKAKEQNRIDKNNASVVSPVLVKEELENGESFEKVVDSVLDEEIAVIYNGEGKYPITWFVQSQCLCIVVLVLNPKVRVKFVCSWFKPTSLSIRWICNVFVSNS